MPTEVWSSSWPVKSATICSSWPRVTPEMVAIAAPSFCTSLALMCLSTSAASVSPRLIRSTAARWVPLSSSDLASGIVAHPVLHHLRDLARVLLHGLAGLLQAGFVGIHRRRQQFGGLRGLARQRAERRRILDRGQHRLGLARRGE